jgi:hypothetical protein
MWDYAGPTRPKPLVVDVRAEVSVGTGHAKLLFNEALVDPVDFRSNWQSDYPMVAHVCELAEEGCVLKAKQSFADSGYEGVCEFCERHLWNSLIWRHDPIWHIPVERSELVRLDRAGYYFVALFILGHIARYEPDLLHEELQNASELGWFLERFLGAAERFFPQLMLSWAHGEEVYFTGMC